MALALSILPIILTIFCGYGLVQLRILPRENWSGIETLCFRLLFPVVLISSIAFSDVNLSQFGPMIVAVIAALVLAGLAVLALRWARTKDQLPNPAFTTLFQTTTRWNAFIALAAAELLFNPQSGADGVALIAVAMAVLIPVINIANIVVLATFGTAKTSIKQVAMMVIKNPLVQGCAIGIAINLFGIWVPKPAIQTLDLIGRASLGVCLLAVGAGIDPARFFKISSNLWLGVVLRLVLCPALFLGFALYFGLGRAETLAGVLILAVPAATNGYIIAKQMGGDADLYADILAWQTVVSMLALPLFAAFLAPG